MSRLTKVFPSGFVSLDAAQFPFMTQNEIDDEVKNSPLLSTVIKELRKYENNIFGEAEHTAPARLYNDELKKVIGVYQGNIAPITSIVSQSISDWLEHMDAEVIIWAITEAVKQNKRSWKYIEGILKNHFNAGRTTLAAVQSANSGYRAQKNDGESVFGDNGVDYDELEAIMRGKM